MKLKTKIRKGITLLVTFTLVAGIIPVMQGSVNEVQAATGGSTPSVTTFATKDVLMSDFDLDGINDTVGKLDFGKNSDGNPQEWYIAGKDSGVSGDNIIIFAASSIATGQVFEGTYNKNKTYDSAWGCTYQEGTNISEVYPNHYGASDLRVALQRLLVDVSGNSVTSYFTTAEQDLMNATTVTTTDTNNNVNYTTTDKLYALKGDDNDGEKLCAGSGDSAVIVMDPYWKSGDRFWLRSPSDSLDFLALIAGQGFSVSYSFVDYAFAVQPASNLNLSSVLFASAATAASSDSVLGTIASGKAMKLRLEGSSKAIGSVTYNKEGIICANKEAAATGTVSLVVQGNDGTNDWYYSKVITGEASITATDIKTELGFSSDISLDDCKIWLETTEDNVSYAKMATNINWIPIDSVEVADLTAPAGGQALNTEASSSTIGLTTASQTPTVTWTKEASPVTGIAEYNTTYKASVTLMADVENNYKFASDVTATINGTTATVVANADETITVSCDFTTAKAKLLGITAPSARAGVANGTAKTADALGLPETVTIETEDTNVTTANVTWDLDNLVSGSYDPSVLTEQSFRVKGTVILPANIENTNGISLETSIQVTVSAAGVVGSPTADVAGGTYTSNQSIELSSSTEGASIYYTVDGSEPTASNGTLYSGAINITGIEGASVPTTIKAIAVKSGMRDSAVSIFEYTINIPAPAIEAPAIEAPAIEAPVITKQPESVTIKVGETATFRIIATGTDLVYQWQIDRKDGNGFVNIAAAKAASYTISTVDKECNGFKYQCVVSNTVGTVTSNVVTLYIAEEETLDTPEYNITDGGNSAWALDEDGSITIIGDGDFSKFAGVKVDGSIIDESNYHAKSGSTIITLKASYLNTLSVGTHTFEILWTDGSASTTFTVSQREEEAVNTTTEDDNDSNDDVNKPGDDKKDEVPDTGDHSHISLYFLLMLLSGFAVLILGKKELKLKKED
jgi:hypothetical protein